MSVLWLAAGITGWSFVAGTLVGFLIAAVVPGVARLLAFRAYRDQVPWPVRADDPGAGPPVSGPASGEPGDRDRA